METVENFSEKDQLSMKLPALLAIGGFLEDKIGESYVFSENEISHNQYVVLIHLWRSEGPIKMKDIAEILMKSPANATIQVDHLEKKGMLRRVASKSDRRIQNVKITQKGLESLTQMQKKVLEFLNKMLNDVSLNELRTTVKTLRKLTLKSQDLLKIDFSNVLRLTE